MKSLVITAAVLVCPSMWQMETYKDALANQNGGLFAVQRFAQNCTTIYSGGEYQIKERATPDIMKISYWPTDRIERDAKGKEIWRGREQEGYALLTELQPPERPLPSFIDQKKLDEQHRKNLEVQRKWGMPGAIFVIEE